MDGDHLLDGVAKRLIKEWKISRGKWIDKQQGVEQEPIDPVLENLLQRAGSSTFTHQPIPDLNKDVEFLLLHTLAAFESDSPGDIQEWNLFDSYLNRDDAEDGVYERYSLSNMLQCWKRDMV